MASEDIETFLAIARRYLVNVSAKFDADPITHAQKLDLCRVIASVEAAIKMRSTTLDSELKMIDWELEEYFRAAGGRDHARQSLLAERRAMATD